MFLAKESTTSSEIVLIADRSACVSVALLAVWGFLLKCCERAKLLLCPLEQNHYPSPDKV